MGGRASSLHTVDYRLLHCFPIVYQTFVPVITCLFLMSMQDLPSGGGWSVEGLMKACGEAPAGFAQGCRE